MAMTAFNGKPFLEPQAVRSVAHSVGDGALVNARIVGVDKKEHVVFGSVRLTDDDVGIAQSDASILWLGQSDLILGVLSLLGHSGRPRMGVPPFNEQSLMAAAQAADARAQAAHGTAQDAQGRAHHAQGVAHVAGNIAQDAQQRAATAQGTAEQAQGLAQEAAAASQGAQHAAQATAAQIQEVLARLAEMSAFQQRQDEQMREQQQQHARELAQQQQQFERALQEQQRGLAALERRLELRPAGDGGAALLDELPLSWTDLQSTEEWPRLAMIHSCTAVRLRLETEFAQALSSVLSKVEARRGVEMLLRAFAHLKRCTRDGAEEWHVDYVLAEADDTLQRLLGLQFGQEQQQQKGSHPLRAADTFAECAAGDEQSDWYKRISSAATARLAKEKPPAVAVPKTESSSRRSGSSGSWKGGGRGGGKPPAKVPGFRQGRGSRSG